MVNSFRTEMARKKAIFDLLTDDRVTQKFPAAERRVLRDYLPWTRVVAATKTTYGDTTVDLHEFILKNREKLVLKPNDESVDAPAVRGWDTDNLGWERALRAATRSPFVVQERVAESTAPFPVYSSGQVEYREMTIDVQPHCFLGRVHGCSTQLSSAAGFSSVSGLTPTFILDAPRAAR
jgi:hypothetical protein